MLGTSEALLAALDPEQREVAEALQGPGLRPGGRRDGERPGPSPTGSPTASSLGGVEPAVVLAVTFTARAAGEMRGGVESARARVGGISARTFHAAALRQLTYSWPRVVGGAAAAGRQQGPADRGGRGPGPGPAAPAPCCGTWPTRAEIEWAKVTQVRPDEYARAAAARAARPRPGRTLAAVYAAYEE